MINFNELWSKREVVGRWAFKLASFFFVFLGIFLNWYIISKILYGIDILPTSQKIFISIIDVIFIFVGYLFWRFRNNFEKQVNFILLFFTICICFFATEGVLHVVSKMSVSHPVVSLLTENCPAEEPYCVKPNVDIKTKIGFDTIKIKTNSFGMAGGETSIENLDNKKRVALLGDSNTFGFWASSLENSFAGIIYKNLDKENFEVLDFGVPGYGQAQEEILLKNQAIKFKPSYAVLFFTNANDVKENYLGKDMHTINKDGMAVIDQEVYREKMGIKDAAESVAQGKSKWLSKIKDLMNSVRNSYIYTYAYSFFQTGLKIFQVPMGLNDFLSPMYWSRSNYTEIANQAKSVTIEKIDNIFNFCKNNNIKFSIVFIPFYEQVYFKNPAGADYNVIYPQKYIEDYAKSKNIIYLDLLSTLREYAKSNQKEKLYNEDGLHFNDNGHRIAGDLVSEFLKNNFLPK